jgi:CHAT domain-containing protein/tetratricopeptide (TPR) repeat protein
MTPLNAFVGVACLLYIALILSLLASFLPVLNFGLGLFLDQSNGKSTLGCFMILLGWSMQRYAPYHPKHIAVEVAGSGNLTLGLLFTGAGVIQALNSNWVPAYFEYWWGRLILLCVLFGLQGLAAAVIPLQIMRLNRKAREVADEGRYEEGIEFAIQARDLTRQYYGEKHVAFALSLIKLALVYEEVGNYAEAERLFCQAVEIDRSERGENHISFAVSLTSLATLYLRMGNYSSAEPLYRRAIEIIRQATGEDKAGFAKVVTRLAILYLRMGNHAAAEPLFRQVKEIVRKVEGEDSPIYALALNNQAGLYLEMGKYGEAETLFRQALELFRKVAGEDDLSVAHSRGNLARVYVAMGNHMQAETLIHQALESFRKSEGEDHQNFGLCLTTLAAIYIATGRVAAAMNVWQQFLATQDRMIGHVCSFGSERQRLAYLATMQSGMQGSLSLLLQHLHDVPAAIHAALDVVLRRKAIVAESLAVQRDAMLGGKHPDLQPALLGLARLRRQLAQKTLAGPGPEGLAAHQQHLAQLNAEKERQEGQLARQIPEVSLEQQLRAADCRAVALGLREGAVLVEFVRFNVWDFGAVPGRGESEWKPARYLAFVLPAGQPDQVQMIDLGEADPIDRQIADFRAGITGEGRDLGVVPPERTTATIATPGAALRVAVFDPLQSALGKHKRLLLAPDGDLCRLPFEALPSDGGRRLIDDYQISYVSVGRDVLRFGSKPIPQPAPPLIVADPNFDLDQQGAVASVNSSDVPGRRSVDLQRDHVKLQPAGRLTATLQEGQAIAAMLGNAQLWTGDAALDGRLKKDCRSPRILHLATHGHFLKAQPRDPNKGSRDLGAMGLPTGEGMGRLSGPGMENPLLRSWLVLAGFNTWLRQGQAAPDAEDGILTAEDVSGLDLLDTELVVLSACETGLGEIHVGEGVFGLQRAFILAGTKTLVMSLWSVPDDATRELMENFYRRILGKDGQPGEPIADALHAAQNDLRQKYPDPYYWGAFVCLGDPGPLRSGGDLA